MLPTECLNRLGGGSDDGQETDRRRRVGAVGTYPQRRRKTDMLVANQTRNYQRIRAVYKASAILSLQFDKAMPTLATQINFDEAQADRKPAVQKILIHDSRTSWSRYNSFINYTFFL